MVRSQRMIRRLCPLASIQDFLKLQRENRGLTQREISLLMGIGGAYSKIENGLTPIKPWQYLLFCQSLSPVLDAVASLSQFNDFNLFSPSRLKRAMKKRGMTRSSLAKDMGLVKPAPVSYWCTKAIPSPENLAKLEKVLGLSKDELQDSFHRQVRRLFAKGTDVSTFASPRSPSKRSPIRHSKVLSTAARVKSRLRVAGTKDSTIDAVSTSGKEKVLVLLSKKVYLMQKPALKALDPEMLEFEVVK